MSLFSRPSAAARTICARTTSRARVLLPRDHFVSVILSSSVKVMAFAIRMASIWPQADSALRTVHEPAAQFVLSLGK